MDSELRLNSTAAKTTRQYARFLFVGLLATTVHLLGFVIIIEWTSLTALVANLFAFAMAVLISFVGHFVWTFRDQTRRIKLRRAQTQLVLFFLTAALGAILNSTIAWLVVDYHKLNYLFALPPMALVVPVITFSINRRWVFTDRNQVK